MYQTPYSYPNPYQNQMYQQTSQQIVKVHGKNGADMYHMIPNSSAILLDETEPLIYLAQTDGAGYKTITTYDIQLHQELPPVDTRSLEQRITKLEELINESHNSSIKSGKYEQNRSGKTDGSNAQNFKQSASNG